MVKAMNVEHVQCSGWVDASAPPLHNGEDADDDKLWLQIIVFYKKG